MIDKQLAGIVGEQENSHIIVEPWIPKAIEKKKGFFQTILSFNKLKLCKKKKKLKADDDLNSTNNTSNSSSKMGKGLMDEDENEESKLQQKQNQAEETDEEDEDDSNEAFVKKFDYIQEKNIMIIHSFRKAEIYLMPTELNNRARKIQEIHLEEDCNVSRCFAFNPDQLIFGIGKQLICYEWCQHTQFFNELEVHNLRDEITQVCGNVEDSQEQNVRNGFIVRSAKNYLYLVRFMDGKVVIKGQAYIDDNKIHFEKERNFMFYHETRVIMIRWQANYQSEFQKQGKNSKKTESSFSISSKSMQLKTAVIITIYECNPKITNNNFFVKPYSHRLELKEFEVINQIDEAYILPQMQNGKNRIAVVCQGKTFLLVFGYKDGSYILDKAAHNKIRLNFDINNNIIVGAKENNICEISTFNDSGSYESVLHAQSFFHQTQSCIDVQENFELPFYGDLVVAIEQIKQEHGFEYFFLVQEPVEDDDDEEEEDEEEEDQEEVKDNEVRNRKPKHKKSENCEGDDHHHHHDDSDEDNKKKVKPKNSSKSKGKDSKKNKNHNKDAPQKISENIIFSIYKMKIVAPKEKLRYLIQEGLDTEQTMKQFGFTNEIEFMITWEQSKKTYIDAEKYLIDSRPVDVRNNSDLLGVKDYKYLKQELKWLVKERNLKVGEINRILLHILEVFVKNQFSCTYSTPEYHQKFENIQNRLSKIAQILFTYQKMIVIYSGEETLPGGLNEFNKIWKNMTLQELFLLVLEKKQETNLIEFVSVFKPEILNNYYTLFYEVRRQLRDMPMKTIFMKMDFLLPLSITKQQEIMEKCNDPDFFYTNKAELGLWNMWQHDNDETLFCKHYAKRCASNTYEEQEEVDNKVIPYFISSRDKNSKKFIYSTGVEKLQDIKEALQSSQTYMKLVNQFTLLYGEVDFSLLCLEAAIKEKGFENCEDMKKEYINLSLYSILQYENNLIDIDYTEFKQQKTLLKFCQIITHNPTNPSIILCHKTMKLFSDYSPKHDKFLKILRKFIHRTECTPHIFHEVFKCIQKEFDEEHKNSIFQNLFDFICEKLSFEHHDYLEEYVDMLQEQAQKEKIQLYSNMSRLIYNFGINKNIGYLDQFVNYDENKNDQEEEIIEKQEEGKKPKEIVTNKEIKDRAEKLVEEIIQKYVYNNVSDKNKQVALDRSLNIIDIRKITHMKTLLNYLQDNLLGKILKKGDSEGRLLRKLLECEKFDQFRDLQSSTSLSVEDVDRIILLNIRNTYKKYRTSQIKRYIAEHFSLLKLDNPTRTQEQAFFDLACLLLEPPILLDIYLPELRKKEKFTFLREVLNMFQHPQKISELVKVDFYSLHKFFTLFDKPDEEYMAFREPEFQQFLRDYALNLESVEKIVEVIDILKKEKSSFVSDLCYYLITQFDGLKPDQRKRFTQLGLLECQDEKLMMDIVSVIHQNKVNQLPLKEVQNSTNNLKEPQNQQEAALLKSKQILGKENSTLAEIKEDNEEQNATTQENISSSQNIPSANEQPKQQSSKWGLMNILSKAVQGFVGVKEQLKTKGGDIRILSQEVLSVETRQSLQSNEKEIKKLLYKFYEDLTTFVSEKKISNTRAQQQDENDDEEQESEQNQVENRKRQIELFCKLLTRDPPSQAFYQLALNKQYYDLQLISEIFMKLLKNNFITFDNTYLVNQMVKICIFRLGESPKSSIFYTELTKQKIKDTFLPYLQEKYQKNDNNRKIFERFFESFILIKQLSYFQKYITKETEHKFLFEKAFRNSIIGQMIQESGNLEIFETEPDIFRMEDFNTKELLISSIVCELRNNDIDKALGLWRKIVVMTKSEQQNHNKNQLQIDQGWIDSFRKIYERSKHLKALIELMDRIHGENKDIFDKFVERKAFQLLKSLNNVQCDVDMSKYVKFEQIFKCKELQMNISGSLNNNVIKLRDPSEESRRILSKSENNERVIQTLKQINKNEIRQDLEEYNVFVLAHVLGYFIEGADSLVYYLFTKKLLKIKDKKITDQDDEDEDVEENKLIDSGDEMYSIKQSKNNDSSQQYGGQQLQRKEIVEIMIDRIGSVEFIQSQIQKISKKTETDPQKLKKYRFLLNLLGERQQILIENSLTYTKYNSSSYQIQQNTNRKQMSESLYLRMTRHIESSKGGDQLSDKSCIWKYFETLLSQESTNLLDCSECKSLVTEFIQSKFTDIISIYESASVEFRANFSDIVNEQVEDIIANFCQQAPLRKQILQLLERIQLNMENVDGIIFDVIVSLVLQQNSNDSINIVLVSTKDALVLTNEQNSILLQLSAVLRMSFLLQDSNIINQMKLALTQNITNINYFIEKYLREVISKINQSSTVADIIKLKYLASYLKNNSLYQELVLNCAENLLPNVLIPLLTKKYLSFEDIDIIDNTLNQTFIQAFNAFGTQIPEQQLKQIITILEEHQIEICQPLFYGFVLQYIGAAAFKKRNEIYKQLFDTLISIINKKQEYEDILQNSTLHEFKTEIEFNSYLEEQKQCFRLCSYKSIDDLIVYNIIDLSRQQKYYDAAKLNYKYQNHSGENGVADYLKKLKEDIIPMQSNSNLSQITLKLLDMTKNEIKKIS